MRRESRLATMVRLVGPMVMPAIAWMRRRARSKSALRSSGLPTVACIALCEQPLEDLDQPLGVEGLHHPARRARLAAGLAQRFRPLGREHHDGDRLVA